MPGSSFRFTFENCKMSESVNHQTLRSGRASYPDQFVVGDTYMQKTADYLMNTLDVSMVMITCHYWYHWNKSTAGLEFPATTLPNILYRSVVQDKHYVEIEDCMQHPSYKFINLQMASPIIRFIACMPISSSDEIIGAITLIDRKPKRLAPSEITVVKTISEMMAIHVACIANPINMRGGLMRSG